MEDDNGSATECVLHNCYEDLNSHDCYVWYDKGSYRNDGKQPLQVVMFQNLLDAYIIGFSVHGFDFSLSML